MEKHYGLYLGFCVDNLDPDNRNRITLRVPQIFGETAVTTWALPCSPVTSNANHPDHKKHLASEVAALLVNHSATVTSSSGGSPSHTHSTTVTFAHTGNSLSLNHDHETAADTDERWNDSQETNTTAEHTPHRVVPKINQPVWVMFVAGDANFPVWIGILND